MARILDRRQPVRDCRNVKAEQAGWNLTSTLGGKDPCEPPKFTLSRVDPCAQTGLKAVRYGPLSNELAHCAARSLQETQRSHWSTVDSYIGV